LECLHRRVPVVERNWRPIVGPTIFSTPHAFLLPKAGIGKDTHEPRWTAVRAPRAIPYRLRHRRTDAIRNRIEIYRRGGGLIGVPMCEWLICRRPHKVDLDIAALTPVKLRTSGTW